MEIKSDSKKVVISGYEGELTATRQINLIEAIGKVVMQIVYEVVQPETRTVSTHNVHGSNIDVNVSHSHNKSNVFIIYDDFTWCKLMC